MSENSDNYRTVVAGFTKIIEAMPDDRWSASSPCADWTARHVVGHVINGMHRVSSVETGIEPDRSDPARTAGDDPVGVFCKARDLAFNALTDENLAKSVNSPMGDMPLDQLIGMFLVGDVLIHTWDLAQAAGLPVTLDPALVEKTYNDLQPIDSMIRMPGVFDAKIEPPEGADLQTRLMCFVGRRL